MTALIKKYETKERKFKMAPDDRFITVYIRGRLNGFIWNTNKIVLIDGEEVVSSDFFR